MQERICGVQRVVIWWLRITLGLSWLDRIMCFCKIIMKDLTIWKKLLVNFMREQNRLLSLPSQVRCIGGSSLPIARAFFIS